jgi:hypothetical protein
MRRLNPAGSLDLDRVPTAHPVGLQNVDADEDIVMKECCLEDRLRHIARQELRGPSKRCRHVEACLDEHTAWGKVASALSNLMPKLESD